MTNLSLQTFTIRNLLKSNKGIDKTLKKVKELGIDYLELAYYPFNMKDIETLKIYLDKYDLKVLSSQIKLSVVSKRYLEIVKIHKLLNIKYLAISVIPFINLYTGRIGLRQLAKKLNRLGKNLKENGIQLLFHHHDYEFIKFNKKMALDILIEHLDRQYVQILSDTYWIKKGNFNIVKFLEERKGIIKALHLRGYKNNQNSNLLESNINITKVIDYIVENNFYYGSIEQDTQNELEEIEKSIKAINLNSFEQ